MVLGSCKFKHIGRSDNMLLFNAVKLEQGTSLDNAVSPSTYPSWLICRRLFQADSAFTACSANGTVLLELVEAVVQWQGRRVG
jgi:hypothetical protein